MGNDFSKRHEGYREEIDKALEGVPASVRESVRRGVYEVIEKIYIDCARLHIEKPFVFRRIHDLSNKLSSEVEGALGREDPALGLLRDEACIYSALAKGKTPQNDPDYVFGKVKGIIVDQLGVKPEKVHIKSDLAKDLGPDSLDIVEIGMEIDSELGIKIPDGDLAGFKTVGDIVNYVMEHGSSSEK